MLDISLHSLSCICFLKSKYSLLFPVFHTQLYTCFFLNCYVLSSRTLLPFDVHWTGSSLLFACHLFPQIRQTIKRLHWQRFPCKRSHGCSPLVPSIQTDLLCWGVISTGRPSPPLLPGFLGPPKGRRLMSTRNFVPHFLQPPPDPPWKTLAPAQRAPVSP